MYTLLSKSIYFHPPGTKPSLKPPELIQNPEKPLTLPTACSSISSDCSSLLLASMSFFDNHSDWFQLGSVSKGKWCITHFSTLPPSPVAFPAALSVFLSRSLPLSAARSSCSKQQSWCLAQTASVSTNPPRDRQKKKSEWGWGRWRGREKERARKEEGEDAGMAPTNARVMPTMLTLIYPFLNIQMIPGGVLTVSDFFECEYTLSVQMRPDNSCWHQREYANDMA